MKEPEKRQSLREGVIFGVEIVTALAATGWLAFQIFEANPGLAKLLLLN